MPERRDWTEAADNTIRRMRADGATWAAIGAVLGLSRNTIIERGRRIHAAGGPVQTQRPPRPPEDDPNRGPLPAGHPISWGLLTAGTVLEGVAYTPLSAERREAGR
ncbi:AsnC family protein [Acidiphilium sp. AL]|uniref:AsnC family protein n=1 Tax=Acidiphilium iwatense TaxID=768198 RepID=A0ABS9DWW9_9PROT|nr:MULTISPECIES: AsnC family protein [Acidiphilium]MCF3946196.1 AsnC family protein [Acidiphilium iwatense]MCU4158768.1 AsnC family protein [Acidiphilium sp. AL]